jgi:hypothetical protein
MGCVLWIDEGNGKWRMTCDEMGVIDTLGLRVGVSYFLALWFFCSVVWRKWEEWEGREGREGGRGGDR